MAATRYLIPAIGDDDQASFSGKGAKDAAKQEAERRAAQYGVGVDVYTSGGTLAYTAEAPLIDDEPADDVPEVQIDNGLTEDGVIDDAEEETTQEMEEVEDGTGDEPAPDEPESETVQDEPESETVQDEDDLNDEYVALLQEMQGDDDAPEDGIENEPAEEAEETLADEDEVPGTWVATDQDGAVLCYANGETIDDARRAVNADLGVDGGYALRPLRGGELAELGNVVMFAQPPAEPEAEAASAKGRSGSSADARATDAGKDADGRPHFPIASRLAAYLEGYLGTEESSSLLAALSEAPLVKAAGKGHAKAVTCSVEDAQALREILEALHSQLAGGTLKKVPFRTTTLARHLRRIDTALAS